jgi:hypothetical protein
MGEPHQSLLGMILARCGLDELDGHLHTVPVGCGPDGSDTAHTQHTFDLVTSVAEYLWTGVRRSAKSRGKDSARCDGVPHLSPSPASTLCDAT